MKEVAFAFGSNDALVGVLSLPAVALPPASPVPGVVFWNAGLLHRVGPARLYVTLARQFAALGYPAIRFDLPGRGDSAAPSGAEEDRVQSVRAVQIAMDALSARTGVRQFILIGLCSGADQAHAVTVDDPRVAGLVALDGYAYPTVGFWCRRIWNCISNPHRLSGMLRRLCRGGRVARVSVNASAEDIGTFDVQFPPREQVQRELETLLARKVQSLFVYSGESGEVFNHTGQFHRMFPGASFGTAFDAVLLPDTDHLFGLPGNGDEVAALITDWVLRRFPL